MVKIFGIEGSDNRTEVILYVVVFQVVLVFGLETWVVNPWLEHSLAGFHRRAVQQMAFMGTERQFNSTWVYPPIGLVLVTVVLEEIGVYITRRQNTVAQYIMTRPIMDLCLAAERRLRMRLSRRWW